MDKIELLSQLKQEKIVAVIRGRSVEEGLNMVEAVVKGGIKFIEITFTVPQADQLISQLVKKYRDTDVVIGAGTCLDPETARVAILAGAQFVVSPSFSRSLIELCNRYAVPVMTGAQTITEIVRTMELGVDVIKLFPGDAYKPSIVKSINGPLPHAKLMPTGGVCVENIVEWFHAGAFAVGTGSSLTKGALTGDFEAITEETRKFIAQRDIYVSSQK